MPVLLLLWHGFLTLYVLRFVVDWLFSNRRAVSLCCGREFSNKMLIPDVVEEFCLTIVVFDVLLENVF